MSTAATIKMYDMLRVKLGEQEAQSFVQNFEESFQEKFEDQKEILATKADIADVRIELREFKAEIIKWMFIFWVGTIGVLTGIMFALLKAFVEK